MNQFIAHKITIILMRKGVLIAIIIGLAILIGLGFGLNYYNSVDKKSESISNATITSSSKHYVENLEENLGSRAP